LADTEYVERGPLMIPFGWFVVEAARALRTSTVPRPMLASCSLSTCTRTAGCCPPPTNTCPTPLICDIFWARMLLAASNTCASGNESERSDRMRMGESAGLTLR
jgi:hypothetical protein